MKFLSIIVALLVLIFSASAFLTTEITAPTAFSYSPTLEVNISGGINVSAFPFLLDTGEGLNFSDNVVNITILNCTVNSAGTCTYGILASSLPLTINATNRSPEVFWNFTATFTNDRHKVRLNFTNISRADDGSFGGALTAERIIQIDVQRNIIELLGGVINFSTDGNISANRIELPLNNIPGSPSISFGDGDSGIYESSDDNLRITLGGVFTWDFSSVLLGGSASLRPILRNEDRTATNPNLLPDGGDLDTGIGGAAADQLSLIAGGTEGIRVKLTSGVIDINLTGNITMRDTDGSFKTCGPVAGTFTCT